MKAYLLTLLRGAIRSRLTGLLLVAGSGVLMGCTSLPELHHSQTVNQMNLPEQQLPDYLSAQCSNIWQQDDVDTLENPLYWLRGMECAQRLSPAEARIEARQWSALTWQDTFKRGILLSPAKITPAERRKYMTQLDMLATDIPLQIRSLFMVWRDGQRAQLSLVEERSRYTKLQQTTDSQLDELHQTQQFLRNELDIATKKLETMSDIERQLSSRKSGSNYVSEEQRSDTQGSSGQ